MLDPVLSLFAEIQKGYFCNFLELYLSGSQRISGDFVSCQFAHFYQQPEILGESALRDNF